MHWCDFVLLAQIQFGNPPIYTCTIFDSLFVEYHFLSLHCGICVSVQSENLLTNRGTCAFGYFWCTIKLKIGLDILVGKFFGVIYIEQLFIDPARCCTDSLATTRTIAQNYTPQSWQDWFKWEKMLCLVRLCPTWRTQHYIVFSLKMLIWRHYRKGKLCQSNLDTYCFTRLRMTNSI